MLYKNLQFPKVIKRPFFYTNFVSTVDGKVQVKKEGYWPIGSRVDRDVLLELRAHADALIHGKNLASEFGLVTLNSLKKPSFINLRKHLGKDPQLPYYVVTSHSLHLNLPVIIKSDIQVLVKDLYSKGYKNVLVEGGPHLLGSFLKMGLMDELFLTIAPKIFGNEANSTLTLIEGYLFPPQATKNLKLLFSKQIGDELYLRYKVIR